MKILVTNDDGIHAEGLRYLVEAAKSFGEITVVAPDKERSACGHSMTMAEPLRIHEHSWPGCNAYSVSGVPADCVNIGLTTAFPDGCDLVLSGFNHGPNLGIDITYSGTVAGAMEGILNRIPSIAFSMANIVGGPLYFESGAEWVQKNLEWLTSLQIPSGTLLNVNLPSIPGEQYRDPKFVKMGGRIFGESVEQRIDPWGKPYFWQGGNAFEAEPEANSDFEAIMNLHPSITPIQLDWTNETVLSRLNNEMNAILLEVKSTNA